MPLLTGVLTAVSFPSWHLFPVIWVSLIPLFLITWGSSLRYAARAFFLSGLTFYLILLQWLLCNIYWAGGWAVWGYVALCVLMAAYWGCFGAIWAYLMPLLPNAIAGLFAACLWVVMEYLQGKLFTGFGWGALGYVHSADLPLLQLSAVGGVALLSFCTVLINVLVTQVLRGGSKRWMFLIAGVMVLIISHALGFLLLKDSDIESETFNVGLVQSNFPQEVKWDPEYSLEMIDKTVDTTRDMLNVTGVDLIVWPEALVVLPLDSPGVMPRLKGLTTEASAPLFTGISRYVSEKRGWANSSCVVDERGQVLGYYDKIHLAPFGEYVPLGKYLPFITRVVPAIGEMVPGESPVVFEIKNRRIGPLICFEVLFPEMAARLRRNKANCLVVITNLAWFGVSNAIPQEWEISRVRAVENRLPLVHCANTGITGVIDPYGRYTTVGETHVRTFGVFPVAAPVSRPVPFEPLRFSQLCVLLSLVAIGYGLIRRSAGKHRKSEPRTGLSGATSSGGKS